MKTVDTELNRRLEFWEKWFREHGEAITSPVASWREIEINESDFQEFLKDIRYSAEELRLYWDLLGRL